jgi:hypothetical protein
MPHYVVFSSSEEVLNRHETFSKLISYDSELIMSEVSKQQPRQTQAFDPGRPGLLQPWKDYVSRGLISVHAEFMPTGTTVFCKLLGAVADKCPSGFDVTRVPMGVARETIQTLGLDKGSKPKKGEKAAVKQPPRPIRNLQMDELKGNNNLLKSRISSVAKAIQGSVAYGRISSLGLLKEGVSSFESWWELATGLERLSTMIGKKDYEASPEEDQKEAVKYFETLNCPFRGPLVHQSNGAQGGAREKADSTSVEEKAVLAQAAEAAKGARDVTVRHRVSKST